MSFPVRRLLGSWVLAAVLGAAALAFGRQIRERRAGTDAPLPPPEKEPCFFYRFIDRPDTAYFEVICQKPLGDSIVLVPRRYP